MKLEAFAWWACILPVSTNRLFYNYSKIIYILFFWKSVFLKWDHRSQSLWVKTHKAQFWRKSNMGKFRNPSFPQTFSSSSISFSFALFISSNLSQVPTVAFKKAKHLSGDKNSLASLLFITSAVKMIESMQIKSIGINDLLELLITIDYTEIITINRYNNRYLQQFDKVY